MYWYSLFGIGGIDRLQDGDSHVPKSFFTEIIASISDIKFSKDGRHILSRDYMNLKVLYFGWGLLLDFGFSL